MTSTTKAVQASEPGAARRDARLAWARKINSPALAKGACLPGEEPGNHRAVGPVLLKSAWTDESTGLLLQLRVEARRNGGFLTAAQQAGLNREENRVNWQRNQDIQRDRYRRGW